MSTDRVSFIPTDFSTTQGVCILLDQEVAREALRLLSAYANAAGTPNAVSLDCAKVCAVLRERVGEVQ